MTAAGIVVAVGPLPPPVHGAARVTSTAIELLREAGCRVTVTDTAVDLAGGRARYHLGRIRAHLAAVAAVLRLRKTATRALYLGGAGGSSLWYQLAVAAVASLLGYRIVFHHHSFAYLHRRMLPMRLLARVPMRGGCHIALCAGMARALRDAYGPRMRTEVLSNATLLGLLPRDGSPRPRRGGRRALVLGHLSNLTVEKGLEDVLRTLELLRQEDLPVSLELAGPTETAAAATLVDEAIPRLGPALRYLGPIPPDAVEGFMGGLDLFLFPSRYRHEAEPLVVLEALWCGVPVLAYDIGCLHEIIGPIGEAIPLDADFAEAASRWTRSMLAGEEAGGTRTGPGGPRQAGPDRRRRGREELTRVLLAGSGS